MTEHLHGYPYSQDVIVRLHDRAETLRNFSPGTVDDSTAALLDEAAGAISALVEKAVQVEGRLRDMEAEKWAAIEYANRIQEGSE